MIGEKFQKGIHQYLMQRKKFDDIYVIIINMVGFAVEEILKEDAQKLLE